jgi:uncharacterized protein YigE (DUF2233 family)
VRRSETAATVEGFSPMRPLALSGYWIFLFALNVSAAWVEKESRSEESPLAGLVHQHVVFENSENGERATMEFTRFSPKSCRLRLVDNPAARSLAEAMAAANCFAGVNGGYFDENFAPLGWRVADGKMIAPLRRARLFTGAIVSSGSSVKIMRNNELNKVRSPVVTLQCGPFLVDRAQRVTGLDADRVARRTFAAITNADQVILGFCSDISLTDLSAILTAGRDNKVQRALNLDGGSSTAFWFKRKDGSVFSIREQKSVRDFLGVAPK